MNYTKVCTKCGRELPATEEYFCKHAKCRYGVSSQCKNCYSEQKKRYYLINKERIDMRNKKYNNDHKERHTELGRQYYEKNKEKISEHTKIRYKKNRENIIERSKTYYAENKEAVLTHAKQYYAGNKELKANRVKRYYEANKERLLQQHSNYKKSNRDKYNFMDQKRRTLKKNLPATLTKEQWADALSYFNNKCAYCGGHEQLSQDHFIPLSKGGTFTSDNIIPACERCNISKNNRNFAEWYIKQPYYSESREEAINAYIDRERRKATEPLVERRAV